MFWVHLIECDAAIQFIDLFAYNKMDKINYRIQYMAFIQPVIYDAWFWYDLEIEYNGIGINKQNRRNMKNTMQWIAYFT